MPPSNLTQIGSEIQVAVISPCTSCKNNRKTYTDEGYWPCPRKVWEERKKTAEETSDIPDYLVFKGGDDDSYKNPIYAEKLQVILVWTANLVDNNGIFEHGTDKHITPDILDLNFDTTYIKCNELPALVFETETSYYQGGSYKQKEVVLKFGVPPFQIPQSDQPYRINGFCKRLDLAFQTSFKTPDEDVIVSGM